MAKSTKEILEEEQLSLFQDTSPYEYEKCSHFSKNPKHTRLCGTLITLGKFLYEDLGLKKIISEKIRLMSEIKNLNDDYQEPLSILYGKEGYESIEKNGDDYFLKHLVDKNVLYDDNGNWHFFIMLNTNYADLAELLTELLIRGGVADKICNKNKESLKKYLLGIKPKLLTVLDRYFSLDEYKEFIRNTKYLSQIGEDAEDEVKKILEKFGMKTLYEGGHGDYIDMLFGIDLIMDYKGRVYTIQVKNKVETMLRTSSYKKYDKLDYFAAPTKFGVTIKNKNGNITNLDFNGEVIDDPK